MNENTGALVILCTCPDPEIGAEIARTLVAADLAACVTIVPGITSVYRWQGAVETDTEVQLIIKSDATRYTDVESVILDLHPYELPEIIGVPITTGLAPYLAWLQHAEPEKK
jgi:periplasmic divalent cation tolerance protein